MSLRCQVLVVLVWVICLSCKVIMTGSEVVLVNRNVTDSFRVGEDGCTKDTSVCTSSATCQSDGLCLCNSKTPSYRNPVLKINGSEIVYADSYGCIDNEIIRFRAGDKSTFCHFSPFQVIPYSLSEPATEFSYELPKKLHNCSLWSTWVKFPGNETEIKLPWLNESYVNLTVLNNTMYFRWKRSVSNLQGTIITFNLICNNSLSFNYPHCIRAKILGTWSADVYPATTEITVTSTLPKTTFAKTTATTEKQKSTYSSTSSSEEESSESNTLIVALVSILVISLFVNAVLGIIVGFLWKKVQRMKDNNLKMAEIPNIENQRRTNSGNGIHNDGIYEESFPQSGHDNNNARLSDHKYEEPSNYEPLRRNHLQDQSDEHNYQSLTTSLKGK